MTTWVYILEKLWLDPSLLRPLASWCGLSGGEPDKRTAVLRAFSISGSTKSSFSRDLMNLIFFLNKGHWLNLQFLRFTLRGSLCSVDDNKGIIHQLKQFLMWRVRILHAWWLLPRIPKLKGLLGGHWNCFRNAISVCYAVIEGPAEGNFS